MISTKVRSSPWSRAGSAFGFSPFNQDSRQPSEADPRADSTAGVLILDTETRLAGVPSEAWDYRLGNRTALDWVLDQHKEKSPRDPTIRERFNTYRFADHKERVADLLARVTRVSVETVAVAAAMRSAPRPAVGR
jgi:predicted helicase